MFIDTLKTWIVAKDGDNVNSGHPAGYPIVTAGNAKLTIQAAVNAAANGDIIIIYPGNYVENVDLDTGNKSLELIGTNRFFSKIVPATGNGLKLEDNCIVRNLNIEAVDIGTNAIAVDGRYKNNIFIEDCIIYGDFDGVGFTDADNLWIVNSLVKGQYDGGNVGGVINLHLIDSTFIGLGTHGTMAKCRSLYIGAAKGRITGCNFRAERADVSAQDFGGLDCSSASSRTILNISNCHFYTKGGATNTGKAFGIRVAYSSSFVSLNNCSSYIESTAASTKFDIDVDAGLVTVNGGAYDTYEGNVKFLDAKSIPWLQKNVPMGLSL